MLPQHEISRFAGAGGKRNRSTKELVLNADSTVMVAGTFAIIKRTNQKVPAYYVNCPVHGYHDGVRRHPCVKAMSINQPDEPTVLLRLKHWLLEGEGNWNINIWLWGLLALLTH